MSVGLHEIDEMETKHEENEILETAQEVAPAEEVSSELSL
jgi:hypothetical protein